MSNLLNSLFWILKVSSMLLSVDIFTFSENVAIYILYKFLPISTLHQLVTLFSLGMFSLGHIYISLTYFTPEFILPLIA